MDLYLFHEILNANKISEHCEEGFTQNDFQYCLVSLLYHFLHFNPSTGEGYAARRFNDSNGMLS
jgi:hypothetical protein